MRSNATKGKPNGFGTPLQADQILVLQFDGAGTLTEFSLSAASPSRALVAFVLK
ncbi:hypothetical protein JSE7799_01974 [Jannaschia seosinensis]|uniref:Uncharacterized protein n=1 Tax=Jannaschia seosinensis TaxID=313367 RepID=A0A0M7B945_9RHOB|nr:hypothetical protein JSE7799_01974 [Jannaschia seosinensis]